MFSDTMTFVPFPQFCVARKIISGVQSNQGVHGYQGQIRSRCNSGTAGTTVSSLSRSVGITVGSILPAKGSARIGVATVPTGSRTGVVSTGGVSIGAADRPAKSSVGTGLGFGTFSAGFNFKIGLILSNSSGSKR